MDKPVFGLLAAAGAVAAALGFAAAPNAQAAGLDFLLTSADHANSDFGLRPLLDVGAGEDGPIGLQDLSSGLRPTLYEGLSGPRETPAVVNVFDHRSGDAGGKSPTVSGVGALFRETGSLGRFRRPRPSPGPHDPPSGGDPPFPKPGDTVTYTGVDFSETVTVQILSPKRGYFRAGRFGLQTTAFGTVYAFCVDLFTQLKRNGGTYTVYSSSSLASLKLDTAQIGEIGALLEHAQGLIEDAGPKYGSAADIAASIQLAIWDIEYAPNFSFRVGAPNAIVLTDYATFLNDAQNVWPEFFNYEALFSSGSKNQALVTIGAIPEPSTWAMMFLGFAGLSVAGWRARAKARAAARADAVR